jgi:tetratricopeptide (TPR) repeat protein
MSSLSEVLATYYRELRGTQEKYERKKELESRLTQIDKAVEDIIDNRNNNFIQKISEDAEKLKMKKHALAGFVFFRMFKRTVNDLKMRDTSISAITSNEKYRVKLEHYAYYAHLEDDIEAYEKIEKELQDVESLTELVESNFDFDFSQEIKIVQKQIKRVEARIRMFGRILEIIEEIDSKCAADSREKIAKLQKDITYEKPRSGGAMARFLPPQPQPKTEKDKKLHKEKSEFLEERRKVVEELTPPMDNILQKLSQIIKDKESIEEDLESLQKYNFKANPDQGRTDNW